MDFLWEKNTKGWIYVEKNATWNNSASVFGCHFPCVQLHKSWQGKFLVDVWVFLILKEVEPDCSQVILLENSDVLLFLFGLTEDDSSVSASFWSVKPRVQLLFVWLLAAPASQTCCSPAQAELGCVLLLQGIGKVCSVLLAAFWGIIGLKLPSNYFRVRIYYQFQRGTETASEFIAEIMKFQCVGMK